MPTLKQQFQFRKRQQPRGNRCQLTHGERQERINNLNSRAGAECGAMKRKKVAVDKENDANACET